MLNNIFDCWELPKTENDYHKYWNEWHEQDLRDMIKRDRNHPSVIMWSIGNEIREQKEEKGYKIAKELVDIFMLDEGQANPSDTDRLVKHFRSKIKRAEEFMDESDEEELVELPSLAA